MLELVHPYDRFLFPNVQPSADVSTTRIDRDFPSLDLREYVYEVYTKRFPERADYWYGLARTISRIGLYDRAQFDACLDLIDKGLAQPDTRRAHRRLSRLRDEILEELAAIEAELEAIEAEVAAPGLPRTCSSSQGADGALHFPSDIDERERAWHEAIDRGDPLADHAYNSLIQLCFDRSEPEQALQLFDDYCSFRRARRFNIIPDVGRLGRHHLARYVDERPDGVVGDLQQRAVDIARAARRGHLHGS